jgi:hypothetical protein
VQRAVRAGERAGAGRVHEVLRPLLRGVQLRAHGAGARRQRVPLLPRHAHRRPQEEAQVPLRLRVRGSRVPKTTYGGLRLQSSTEDQETDRRMCTYLLDQATCYVIPTLLRICVRIFVCI